MPKKDAPERRAYTIRLRPDLVKQIKIMAIEHDKTIGELLEEGIELLVKAKRKD